MNKLRVILLVSGLLLLLCACGKDVPAPTAEAPRLETKTWTTEPTVREPLDPQCQLFCRTETREEAQKIADLYGITLVTYSNHYARFYTEEDPREVQKRGDDQGWPELSLNENGRLF